MLAASYGAVVRTSCSSPPVDSYLLTVIKSVGVLMQLNVKEFARFMGYSVQAITKNIANGMPVIQKGTQGVPAIIDADMARAWIEKRKTQKANNAATNKVKREEEKAAKKEQRRIRNEGKKIKNFCPILLECANCKKERHQGFFFKQKGGPRAGTRTVGRNCIICENLKDSGADKIPERFSSLEYKKEKEFNEWQHKQWGIPVPAFCHVYLPCKRCKKERHQGFFYRHNDNKHEGVRESALCIICREFGKVKRGFSEYEKKREADFKAWDGLPFLAKVNSKPWLAGKTRSDRDRLRRKLDLDYRIKCRVRRQVIKKRNRDCIGTTIRQAVNRNGESQAVLDRIGFSIAKFKEHFENLFTDGMNWDEFAKGNIHIDHIKPQRLFDLTNDDDWRACWSLSNLQPLWARDNIAKGGKYEEA